jgi:hypothetical protein
MNAQWLLLSTFVFCAYGTGQVWLVQLSSYPLWRFVGAQEFHAYHLAWWRSIWGVVLAPAALTLLGALLMLRWSPSGVPDWTLWLGAALQLALLLGTVAWWGPLMARLETANGDLDEVRYAKLLTTHWLRVALVTSYSVLLTWMISAASSWR